MSLNKLGIPVWLELFKNDNDIHFIEIHTNEHHQIELNRNGRFSPVSFINEKMPNVQFEDEWQILYLYHFNPTKFLQYYEEEIRKEEITFCFTWGLANIIVFEKAGLADNESLIYRLSCDKHKWEKWKVKNGEIIYFENSRVNENEESKKCGEFLLNSTLNTLELRNSYTEYIINISNILNLGNYYYPESVPYFERLHNRIFNLIKSDNGISDIEMIDYLVSLNASLSRLYSQLYGGTNGILYNPCPINNHGLLGIGTANIALLKLCLFIERNVDESYSSGMITCLKDIDLYITETKDIEKRIIEISKKLDAFDKQKWIENEDTIPLIPFFSGRDGFRYGKITNISIPQLCLTNCNRFSWNLMTITHELSHFLVESFISILEEYEDDNFVIRIKEDGITIPEKGINTTFLKRALSLYYSTKWAYTKILNSNNIESLLNEVITHIIDFLLFYNGQVKIYFQYIWTSWLTNPHLKERLQEYIVRSGTAILSISLEKNRETYIKETLKEGFEQLFHETNNKIFRYIIDEFIKEEDEWRKIFELIVASTHIIELVRIFIYDANIAAKIDKEARIVSGDRKLDFRIGRWSNSDIDISNPFYFIKNYCLSDEEKEESALWVLTKIAFLDLNEKEGGS